MKKILSDIDRTTMKALEWATTTKGAFWALFLLIVTAQVIKPPQDIQAWLLVLVSEFYQGVALPGLGASQKAEAEETRRVLQETHDAVMQELQLAKDERQEMRELVSYLHEKLERMNKNETGN